MSGVSQAASGFREALGKHLLAIEERDLDAHRGWFAMKNWRLEVKPVHLYDTPQLGVALFQLEYRETPPGKPPTRQESLLTLVFENRGGKWLMVLDQNTPVKAP